MKRWGETNVSTKTDIAVEHRRRLVARMVGRRADERLGVRGIALALADPNRPDEQRTTAPDGSPWSYVTIARDIAHIKGLWRNENTRALSEHRAEQLAAINEMLLTALNRSGPAWAAEARQLIALQAKMLGTDSDPMRLYEQMEVQMHLAIGRLEARFGGDPALLQQVISALVGEEREMPEALALPHSPVADA